MGRCQGLLQSKESPCQLTAGVCIPAPEIPSLLCHDGGLPAVLHPIENSLACASGWERFVKSWLVAAWLLGTESKSNLPKQ